MLLLTCRLSTEATIVESYSSGIFSWLFGRRICSRPRYSRVIFSVYSRYFSRSPRLFCVISEPPAALKGSLQRGEKRLAAGYSGSEDLSFARQAACRLFLEQRVCIRRLILEWLTSISPPQTAHRRIFSWPITVR